MNTERLYIRCTVCGKYMPVGVHFDIGFFTLVRDKRTAGDRMTSFMRKHAELHSRGRPLPSSGGFEFFKETEMPSTGEEEEA